MTRDDMLNLVESFVSYFNKPVMADALQIALLKIEQAYQYHASIKCKTLKGALKDGTDLPFLIVNHIHRYNLRCMNLLSSYYENMKDWNIEGAALSTRAYLETLSMTLYMLHLVRNRIDNSLSEDEFQEKILDVYMSTRIEELIKDKKLVKAINVVTVVEKVNRYCDEYESHLFEEAKRQAMTESGREYFKYVETITGRDIDWDKPTKTHDLLTRYVHLSELCHPNAMPFIFFNNLLKNNIATYPDKIQTKAELLTTISMDMNYLSTMFRWADVTLRSETLKLGVLPKEMR